MTITALPRSIGQTSSRLPSMIIGLELFLAFTAFIGGVGLAAGWIDLGDKITRRLPFASPVIAGVALAAINGLFPLAVAIAAVAHHPGAPVGHIAVGFVLMTWVMGQVAIVGLTSPIQPIAFLYGADLAALAAAARRSTGRMVATATHQAPVDVGSVRS